MLPLALRWVSCGRLLLLHVLTVCILLCLSLQLPDIGSETKDFNCRNGGRVYWLEYMKPPSFGGSEWSPCASSWAQGDWLDTQGYTGARHDFHQHTAYIMYPTSHGADKSLPPLCGIPKHIQYAPEQHALICFGMLRRLSPHLLHEHLSNFVLRLVNGKAGSRHHP